MFRKQRASSWQCSPTSFSARVAPDAGASRGDGTRCVALPARRKGPCGPRRTRRTSATLISPNSPSGAKPGFPRASLRNSRKADSEVSNIQHPRSSSMSVPIQDDKPRVPGRLPARVTTCTAQRTSADGGPSSADARHRPQTLRLFQVAAGVADEQGVALPFDAVVSLVEPIRIAGAPRRDGARSVRRPVRPRSHNRLPPGSVDVTGGGEPRLELCRRGHSARRRCAHREPLRGCICRRAVEPRRRPPRACDRLCARFDRPAVGGRSAAAGRTVGAAGQRCRRRPLDHIAAGAAHAPHVTRHSFGCTVFGGTSLRQRRGAGQGGGQRARTRTGARRHHCRTRTRKGIAPRR